ncbi:MAG: Type I restriction-modification system subunit M partial [Methanobrevibacter sp. CfCl-M3]
MIKSPKEIKGYLAEAESDAFCCEKSIDELKSLQHESTIAWIKKFKNEVNINGKPLPEVLKRSNIYWYTMKPNTMADICTLINPEDRLFFSRLKECSFVNQHLISFTKKMTKLILNCVLHY